MSHGLESFLAPFGLPPKPSSKEARVPALEQIAISTEEILIAMKQDIPDIKADQESDLRILFGALITTAIGLATPMAHGFKWL